MFFKKNRRNKTDVALEEMKRWAASRYPKDFLTLYGIDVRKKNLTEEEFKKLLDIYLKEQQVQKNRAHVSMRDFARRDITQLLI